MPCVKAAKSPDVKPITRAGKPAHQEMIMEKKVTMYADTINGKFDMTSEDLIAQVRETPIFSDPEEVAAVDSDGTEYTGYDLLEMAGCENEVPE